MRTALVLVTAAAILALGPVAAQERSALQLSMKRAVELATSPEGNSSIQIAGESLKQARARSLEARAALLPDVEGAFRYESETAYLGAYGIKFNSPIPAFQFPTFVGPFSVMDARLSGSQTIFDFASLRRFTASRTGVSAAKSDVDATQEQVAARVARAYLAAVKADAGVETAEANVALSEAILKQAENQKAAGTGTGLEITRAPEDGGINGHEEMPDVHADGLLGVLGIGDECCARQAGREDIHHHRKAVALVA